jgi:hypothetical protein
MSENEASGEVVGVNVRGMSVADDDKAKASRYFLEVFSER